MSEAYTRPEDDLIVRLLHLAGNAFSGHQIGTWCISAETQRMFFPTVLHEAEIKNLFEIGACREYAFHFGPEFQNPFLMSDQNGLVWLGEYAALNCVSRMLIIMGPVFYACTSTQHINSVVDKLCFSGTITMDEKSSYEVLLRKIPVVSSRTMAAYARMLHFAITGKFLPLSEIRYQTADMRPALNRESVSERSWVDYSHVHEQDCHLKLLSIWRTAILQKRIRWLK